MRMSWHLKKPWHRNHSRSPAHRSAQLPTFPHKPHLKLKPAGHLPHPLHPFNRFLTHQQPLQKIRPPRPWATSPSAGTTTITTTTRTTARPRRRQKRQSPRTRTWRRTHFLKIWTSLLWGRWPPPIGRPHSIRNLSFLQSQSRQRPHQPQQQWRQRRQRPQHQLLRGSFTRNRRTLRQCLTRCHRVKRASATSWITLTPCKSCRLSSL